MPSASFSARSTLSLPSDADPVMDLRIGSTDRAVRIQHLIEECPHVALSCCTAILGRKSAPRNKFMWDLLPLRTLWHNGSMCFRITASGDCLRAGSRTLKQEVMLHCARIGYKP